MRKIIDKILHLNKRCYKENQIFLNIVNQILINNYKIKCKECYLNLIFIPTHFSKYHD